ncbi:MAG: NAD(P)H-dependent glycerol-3-phosphate dehydrogenase [Candidatus Aminicenantes bacterium]|nr:NAD(P)H-dependent glycerol-3-phosphate dehydrogenase [Candidatus Aminicenantes bacterium]
MKVSVVGGGSWGSAFSVLLGRKHIQTRLWIRERDIFDSVSRTRENKTFLPGIEFPSSISFHHSLEKTLEGTDMVFIAVPSEYCRGMYEKMSPFLTSDQMIISLTKGIEYESLKRMSQMMQDIFDPQILSRIAVLSGPSFALEVAESHPTAVVVASTDSEVSQQIQQVISDPLFRAYTSSDVTGVEVAGALKNIIAISAGITDGLKFGTNSLAALITRGIAEITRLGVKMGAKPETFAGLAGIGDLVLTCTGKLSRNRYVGTELGKGKSIKKILKKMKMVAEGVVTTLSARKLAEKYEIEMPICEQVYQILYNNKDPKKALKDLMTRKLKQEKIF